MSKSVNVILQIALLPSYWMIQSYALVNTGNFFVFLHT